MTGARIFGSLLILTLFVMTTSCPYRYIDPHHTLCVYRSRACPGKSLIRSGGLTCQDKQLILDVHNRLRQMVALGQVRLQPAASNMRELVWDEELATIAQRWADQCVLGHDTARNVPRFTVGQNVAVTWTYKDPSPAGPGPDFQRQIEDWFDEVMRYGFRRNDVEHYRYSHRTGHYSQLVWSDTFLVGCGYSYFRDKEHGFTKLYVCNYGPGGNILGAPLYKTGQPKCIDPELSPSRRYKGLCEMRGSSPPGMVCSPHDSPFHPAETRHHQPPPFTSRQTQPHQQLHNNMKGFFSGPLSELGQIIQPIVFGR